ncbi:MAG: carbohydrate ABC transporter permease [Propionicimonas sp.]
MLTQNPRLRKRLSKAAQYATLSAFAVTMIYPLYFAILSSFKNNVSIFDTPFALPEVFSFENYARAWELARIDTYFRNSVILTLASVAIAAVASTMAAYALARFRFRLRSPIYLFFTLGLMVPMHAAIVPIAYSMSFLPLRDNTLALIMMFVAFSLPISIMLVYGFMIGIPAELEEAAAMDGCGYFRIFRHVVLPLAVPGIATSCAFNFLSVWNNLLFPLVMISDREKMPLAMGLVNFFGERNADYGGVMAAIVMSIAPPLIFYIALQEKVEAGLTAGAVKG